MGFEAIQDSDVVDRRFVGTFYLSAIVDLFIFSKKKLWIGLCVMHLTILYCCIF